MAERKQRVKPYGRVMTKADGTSVIVGRDILHLECVVKGGIKTGAHGGSKKMRNKRKRRDEKLQDRGEIE